MPTYRVFGLTFASDFPFTYPLKPTNGTPDFTFTCVDRPPLAIDWQAIPPIYTSPYRNDAGESLWRVYRCADCEVMRCADVADFYLFPDRILCHPLSTIAHAVEANFLSAVLAYWLERGGTVALHASAVTINGGAVAFLSHSGNGKSALAAALIQAGHALLTDDILPLTPGGAGWLVQPGFAAMRMWPDEAEFFLGAYESLPRVHPAISKRRVDIGEGGWGNFCVEPQPLACLFIPERHAPADPSDEVTITPVTRRDAVIELVRYSFGARLVQSAGLQPQRMGRFVDLARHVPIYRLSYPSGFAHLARVAAAVERISHQPE
jgi:hypothetical protein